MGGNTNTNSASRGASAGATAAAGGGAVQRQIRLPMSKAVEIAYKNIRMRLSRSLLVTSGIVLALAFLMAIQSGEVVIQGMRNWIAAAAGKEFSDGSVARQFAQLRADAKTLDGQLSATAQQLATAASAAPTLKKDQAKFDPKSRFGQTWKDLDKNVGKLPAEEERLTSALTVNPPMVEVMQRWIDQSQRLKQIKNQIKSPEDLSANMAIKGVPTTPEAIAAGKTQTRWMLGLALLVAFVGILNAMLMSVTERFREIGTMKCLGALDSFIIKLFLIESSFQGMVGTALGIILGLLLTLADAWSKYGGHAFRMLPVGGLVAVAALCLLVGVLLTVAGAVYPAWQAARMQPIEAMRVET